MKNRSKNIPEKELISLLLQRDIRGMEILYDQYSHYLFGIINKIIAHDDVAEIVLQDTFVKIWNEIDLFNLERSRFMMWLINIARNTAIHKIRSKHYKQSVKYSDLDIEINSRKITPQLNQKQTEVIELIYFKGYTQADVAKALNISPTTVKERIKKAFNYLRNIH